jgi:hypothetical protein
VKLKIRLKREGKGKGHKVSINKKVNLGGVPRLGPTKEMNGGKLKILCPLIGQNEKKIACASPQSVV